MDVIKNREPSDEGIPRRLPADLVEAAVVTELRRVMRAPSITAQVIAHLAPEGRVGLRHRIITRTGRPREPGNPLELRGCFAPSRDRRGAFKERRGPFGDLFCVKRPVSEGRIARPTPFETKRKKAPIGAPSRIQYLNVAVETNPATNSLPCRFPPRGVASKPCALLRDKTPYCLTTGQMIVPRALSVQMPHGLEQFLDRLLGCREFDGNHQILAPRHGEESGQHLF